MFARLLIAAMATFAIPVEASLAQQTDLASVKCGDFVGMDQQNATNIVIWMLGYFTYEDDPTVVDMDKEKSKELQIRQYCSDHKDIGVVSAAEIFMDKKYKE
jgi:hypothetical protein